MAESKTITIIHELQNGNQNPRRRKKLNAYYLFTESEIYTFKGLGFFFVQILQFLSISK